MLKKIVILCLALSPLASRADITREQAKDILFNVIGNVGVDRPVAAYLTAAVLPSGSSIEPFINEGAPVVLTANTWFAWIDDEPDAFFSHRTRFVYIKASDGTVTVVNHEWWPEVGGDPPFDENDITADPTLVIISPNHEVAP